MVKDLYNTQRLAQYSKSDLYENWKPKENEIQKGQVNSYINNAATSIRDFVLITYMVRCQNIRLVQCMIFSIG